jgi:hypothetical protein
MAVFISKKNPQHQTQNKVTPCSPALVIVNVELVSML